MPGSGMSRGPATFKQRDVKAAIKAAFDAGAGTARVEVDKAGRLVIVASKPDQPKDVAGNGGWDQAIANLERP
jgi:hypothetical protein